MIQPKHSFNDYGDEYPNSRKVYVVGSREDVRVPMREIRLSDTERVDGETVENESVRVYDTSGPATDPQVELKLEEGLPRWRFEPPEWLEKAWWEGVPGALRVGLDFDFADEHEIQLLSA